MPKCFVWLPGMFYFNRNFLHSINNILFWSRIIWSLNISSFLEQKYLLKKRRIRTWFWFAQTIAPHQIPDWDILRKASQLEIFTSSLFIEKLTGYGKNFRFWLLSGVISPTLKQINLFIYNSLCGFPRSTPFGIVLALNNRELICLKHL